MWKRERQSCEVFAKYNMKIRILIGEGEDAGQIPDS